MAITPLQLTGPEARRRQRAPLIFDPLLLLAALGLIGVSFAVLHDMGAKYPGEASKQLLYAGLGLAGCLVVSRIDYSRLREYRYAIYGLLVVLNIVVLGMPAQQNVHRWIPFPFFSFQSSEFGKLLLVLSLAAVLVERSRKPGLNGRTTLRVLGLGVLPALIVFAQPDLGTAIVYLVIGLAVLYFGGTGWKHLAAIGGVAVLGAVLVFAVAPALGVHVLHGYQEQRLTTFLNGSGHCTQNNTTCYQLEQGLTAIGAGQKTGQGVAGATQVQGSFLPVANEDFIFASLADFYGFAGAALVLSLYALLIWRGLRIMTMAKNLYGTLVAGGVLAMLMFQVFLNVGMTIGIAPVTGVPLPLMSYGGSSVFVTFLAIGLLQSVYIQARLAQGAKARVLVV